MRRLPRMIIDEAGESAPAGAAGVQKMAASPSPGRRAKKKNSAPDPTLSVNFQHDFALRQRFMRTPIYQYGLSLSPSSRSPDRHTRLVDRPGFPQVRSTRGPI